MMYVTYPDDDNRSNENVRVAQLKPIDRVSVYLENSVLFPINALTN